MKLIPIAVEFHQNGHIFILAAPSKEAFIVSFQQHSAKLAEQLAYEGSDNIEDAFTRFRQSAFICGVYSTFTQ